MFVTIVGGNCDGDRSGLELIMLIKQAFFSIIYSVGQIGLGLLVHPYQTMQQLVEDQVFAWMALLPSGVLAVVTVGWRWWIVPSVRMFFSCSQTHFWACDYLTFVSNWLTFFMVYWQVLLLYLLFRFHWVWKEE